MTTPGEHAAEPGPDPELVAQLDFRALYELAATEDCPGFVQAERVRREEALESLRIHRPEPPETPELDLKKYGAYSAYFAAARETNRTTVQRADVVAMRAEKAACNDLARRYVDSPATKHRSGQITDKLWSDDWAQFFASNLHGVVSTARSLARRTFDMERNAILHECFPGINLTSATLLVRSLKKIPVAPAQIEIASEAIHALVPLRTKYADFFQLPVEQQATIVQTLGQEWEALCKLLQTHDPEGLAMPVTRGMMPLAYWPLSKLEQAIEDNPLIAKAKLCRAFVRNASTFEQQIVTLRSTAHIEAIARLVGSSTFASSAKAKPVLSEAEQQLVAEAGFMRYDHALVGVNDWRFYVPLEHPTSLLIARVLRVLSEAANAPSLESGPIINAVWNSMPPAERAFFTKGKSKPDVVEKHVLLILRQLTNRMGITHETSDRHFQIRQA